jgi:HD superfamily phosphodiesterase
MINKIKNQIKKECEENNFSWFYHTHLLAVEKNAKFLLEKLPKANKEVVLLGVWLHDLQRIRKLKGDHAKTGAREAVKVLYNYNLDKNIVKHVKDIILSHPCKSGITPKTLEAKILASADAMSHYMNDFYLSIALRGDRNIEEYKKWLSEKLDRNYNIKISFPFAKKIIKKKHEAFREILK